MPTGRERFLQVARKVKRAAHHLDSLEPMVRRFVAEEPYRVSARVENGGVTYYVAEVKPTPDELPLVAGDVIQCLVTALDHLAYQIVCADTNDHPPEPGKIYFPFANTVKEYERDKYKRLPGASAGSVAAFDQVKPYKGGNDSLWALHQLNRIEKHRTLLTVGSRMLGTDVFHDQMNSLMRMPGFPPHHVEALKQLTGSVVIYDKGDDLVPLHVGQVLFRDESTTTPSDALKFHFGVAIDEPNYYWHADIVDALKQFVASVVETIDMLKPRLG